MFIESHQWKWVALLESNWTVIRQELELLKLLQSKRFLHWPEKYLYTKDWKVFGLYGFGEKIPKNCELCPKTTELIETIPGLTTATFSSLTPGTHILPHKGYTDTVLRCHLGLITPDGCGLRVGNQTREWQEGKCLLFDDTIEHEAWNRGQAERIILLVDFRKEEYLSKEKLEIDLPTEVSQSLQALIES
jgi:ornithine lipid ester-linked acyl 2-hydroxylase